MYELNGQCSVSLCSFSNDSLCYYISQSKSVQLVQKKSHHYEKKNQIVDLIENICRQLFYYSNSLKKVNSRQQEYQTQNIMLDNIKRMTIYNCDRHGLIPEQKLFFLVISYLHSKSSKATDLREYLNQVHCLLTSKVWGTHQEELPFSFVMLLNGQFEQLLVYAKQQFSTNCHPQMIQNLIDLIVYRIQQRENQSKSNASKIQFQKIVRHINESDWLIQLRNQLKKKNQNAFTLSQTKKQIEIVLSILAGNQSVIEQVSKGSWGLYLNLYLNFVKLQKQSKRQHESVVKSYLNKYFSNQKNKKVLSQNQQFLIKLINTSVDTNKFSFHEIYQSTFDIFSPVLSHLIGLILLQCRVIDLYSIFNNKEYYQEILLSLLQASSQVSWPSLVYTIGFMENNSYFKDYNSKQSVWQSLLYQHLPYDFSLNSDLESQVKQIQQKLQDLNMIGLSSTTRSYLNTFFKLQLRQTRSNNRLNQMILQLFFLNLQVSDSLNANQCFHLMKDFMGQYYRNFNFNFGLLSYLENIFERKQGILSEKMVSKIQKLFSLVYKVQTVYDMEQIQTEVQQENRRNILAQVSEFNKLFPITKKRKPISLCIQLLKLCSHLHKKVESNSMQYPQMQAFPQNSIKNYQYTKVIKQFERNLNAYLKGWKLCDQTMGQGPQVSQLAKIQLNYFEKCFY